MSNSAINKLEKQFPNYEFVHESVEFGGIAHAFFVKCPTERDLESSWEEIRNSVGVYFQSNLIEAFEIWNVYLFFLSASIISKELKHAIEHDTLSSRKIVLDQYS